MKNSIVQLVLNQFFYWFQVSENPIPDTRYVTNAATCLEGLATIMYSVATEWFFEMGETNIIYLFWKCYFWPILFSLPGSAATDNAEWMINIT